MRITTRVLAVCLLSMFLMPGFILTGCGDDTTDACKNVASVCLPENSTRCNSTGDGVETCGKNNDDCLVWITSISGACGGHQTCKASGDTAACRCDPECDTADDTQCKPTQTNVIQICVVDNDGCLFWQDGIDCADASKFCDDTVDPAVCLETCTDKCTTGATQCNGSVIQVCAKAGDCYDWIAAIDCAASGQSCSEASGTADCYTPCTDNCTAGTTQCNGSVIHVCYQVGECYDWIDAIDCAESGQSCSDKGGMAGCYTPCTDNCTADSTRCNDSVIQVCYQVGECYDWIDAIDCAESGRSCSDTGGAADCYTPCNDMCTAGATQCNGSVIQGCAKVGDCYDWVDALDCADSELSCYDSTGNAGCYVPCSDECPSAGVTRCNGNTVQTCAYDGDSDPCLDWKDTADCTQGGTSTDFCDNGSCVPCQPECTGKVCGDDGCGGSCGTCNAGDHCENGACVADSIEPGDPCPNGDSDCPAEWPTCLSGAGGLTYCSKACNLDSDCGTQNCCLDIASGKYCFDHTQCSGSGQAGDPCPFINVNVDADTCVAVLTCLGIPADGSNGTCTTDSDCSSLGASLNPDCVGGNCGASFCAETCPGGDPGQCPVGTVGQNISGTCYCVPITAQNCTDPINNVGCIAGQKCVPYQGSLLICVEEGSQDLGEVCGQGACGGNDCWCKAGQMCLGSGVGNCYQICDADNNTGCPGAAGDYYCIGITGINHYGGCIATPTCTMESSGSECSSGTSCIPFDSGCTEFRCFFSNGITEGQLCVYSNDCANGLICDGQTPTCERVCNDTQACTSPDTCQAVDGCASGTGQPGAWGVCGL